MILWLPSAQLQLRKGDLVHIGKRVGVIDSFNFRMVYITWRGDKHVHAVDPRRVGLLVLRKPPLPTVARDSSPSPTVARDSSPCSIPPQGQDALATA